MSIPRLLNSVEDLPPDSTVALYGAGGVGLYVCRQLRAHRPDVQICCFIDDAKTGSIEAIPIHSLQTCAERHESATVLITCSHWRDMTQRLEDAGIQDYFVADPLAETTEPPHLEVTHGDSRMRFYTGNKTLRVTAENFAEIEPDTLRWIETFEIDTVFYDVGASNGLFGIYAAVARHARVVAFEPEIQNVAVVEMNHFLNRQSISTPIMALNLALGAATSVGAMSCQSYTPGAHGKVLGSIGMRGQAPGVQLAHQQPVLVESLDAVVERYGLPAPHHLKIDVDGAELDVLEGAQETVRSPQLESLLVESDADGAIPGSISTQLEDAGLALAAVHEIREIIGTPVTTVKNYLYRRS